MASSHALPAAADFSASMAFPEKPAAPDLVPVLKSEIEIGKPLPWAVYGKHQVLLLNKGFVVESASQLERLSEEGQFYRARLRQKLPGLPDLALKDEAHVAIPGKQSAGHDGIKLSPGDVLYLQPLIDGQSDRYTVRVIGVMKGKSILVSAPSLAGKLIPVREGQPFLARAFFGTDALGFHTHILKQQMAPFSYLHLSYPKDAQTKKVRGTIRAPASAVAAIRSSCGELSLGAAVITDVSLGGLGLKSGKKLGEVGDTLQLSFKLQVDDIEEYIKSAAEIVYSEADPEKERKSYITGVRLLELDQLSRLLIMSVVQRHRLRAAA